MEFSDNILSIEYESFSCGVNVNVGSDVDLCAEYESFSFDPIRIDLLFENCKSKFVEPGSISTKNFALNQIHAHFGTQRLVDFAPTILSRPLTPDDLISMPMTHWLVSLNYICMFDGLSLIHISEPTRPY